MPVLPSPAALTGQLVDDRYRVGAVIGRGAMSSVYRAVDERLDRPVALKVLRPEATDPARFTEEAKLLCALDHPHLVRLHDTGTHDGVPYLVLNLLDGTLADRLRNGPLPAADVARIGAEITAALTYLSARGIVHRDLKPSNILLRADGRACLADLGAALSIDGPRLTATGLTIGTPMYLAPEQAAGDDVTSAADVYSLGLVLLEAATGAPPFRGTHREALAARITRSPEVPASVPAALRAALVAMVALDPAARPSADALRPELARLSFGDDLDAATATAAVATAAAGTAATAGLPGDDVTAELAPPTMVGPIVAASDATEAFELVAPRAGARTWWSDHRDRAVLWVLGGACALAALVGFASADGIDRSTTGTGTVTSTPVATTEPVATTSTIATTTTVAPTTVAPAPQQSPGGGNGEGNGKGPGKADERGRGQDDRDDD